MAKGIVLEDVAFEIAQRLRQHQQARACGKVQLTVEVNFTQGGVAEAWIETHSLRERIQPGTVPPFKPVRR